MNLESLLTFKMILGIVFIVASAFYWILSFIIIYHLTRFGTGTLPKKYALIYFIGTIVFYFVVFSLFLSLDTAVLKSKLELLIEFINKR